MVLSVISHLLAIASGAIVVWWFTSRRHRIALARSEQALARSEHELARSEDALAAADSRIATLREAEIELSAKDERLRDAAIAGNFAIWELDIVTGVYTNDLAQSPDRDAWLKEARPGSGTALTDEQAMREQWHPEDLPAMALAMKRTIKEKVPYHVEGRLTGLDGSLQWRRVHGRPVVDANGRTVKVRGISLNVTAHKLATLQLQAAEARLERAIRGMNDALWEIEIATGSLWLAPRFHEMLGYTPATLPARLDAVLQLAETGDVQTLRNAALAHLRDGTPLDVELRGRTANGEWRWFRLRASCERDANHRPVRLAGSIQDVTEKHEAQRALIAATQTAAAASRAKSEFLANMSHEIRTPMNGVVGMTDLLFDTPLSGVQRDYAETIRASASSLLTIINDILDFSKIEAGKLDVEMIDMDLRDTIEDVARLIALQAHPKGLEVTASVDPLLPDMLRGDPGRLRQVLLNLGGNAVKFTERGEIAIDVRLVTREPGFVNVRVDVRDTGIGIPAERLDRLFKPFSQVDASTTRKFGGTGLGLSIARQLVGLMGGETGVRSTVGAGSVFWFTLRFAVSTAMPATLSGAKSLPTGHATLGERRVLLVDDNATNRRVIGEQLAQLGVHAGVGASADEGYRLLVEAHEQGRPYEVAIVDQQMPGQDGAALGQRISADARLRPTHLILLTSSGVRGDAQRFAELGFAGYLLKPVSQRDLHDCLVLVLDTPSEGWQSRTQPIITRHHLRAQRERSRSRILVAEDNPVNQKVARITLEKLGFRVDLVDNGAEAIDSWKTGRYDLILMDCQMPLLDGYAATREIRRQEGTSGNRIPIVALTAHAMKGAETQCLEAGMDAHLTKPLSREQLAEVLARFLHGMPQREEATPADAAQESDATRLLAGKR
jgi:two-component system sensor histidine kinase/response regulator